MSQTLCPYLSFGTNTAEAMTFYQSVFGGVMMSNTFGEFGTEGPDGALVMHAQLETDAGFTLMGADTPSFMERKPQGGFVVSLSGDEAEALKGYWEKLSDGATVTTPLEKQMWGDEYGSLTDKFGVEWLINVASSS
ncbi:VOC family protein [Lapillicoccus sp.]|uniref:VOC family protein n=1 Tax=Lapillicoccus sp. TaxID=1909287 RepID=UPI003264BDB0